MAECDLSHVFCILMHNAGSAGLRSTFGHHSIDKGAPKANHRKYYGNHRCSYPSNLIPLPRLMRNAGRKMGAGITYTGLVYL